MSRRARVRAIWAAYADCDMTQPCPTCRASIDTWCTNQITGRVRRVPCVDRPRIQSDEPIPADYGDAEVVELDFSEPRHPADLFPDAGKKTGQGHFRVDPEMVDHTGTVAGPDLFTVDRENFPGVGEVQNIQGGS